MDPNAAWQKILALSYKVSILAGRTDNDALDALDELRGQVEALNEWFLKGGFAPKGLPQWKKADA